MVTAAHSNNSRTQLTCIEKDKPKNNNKIRQHEKKQTHLSIPSLLFPCPTPILLKQLPLQLSLPSIATTTSDACSQPSHPPSPPPPSIIIIIVTIKIIISIHHAATSNALLLPPPPPWCRRISKHAAATAKITLPPSFHLHHQAACHHRAPAAATSANPWQPPRYHCLQNEFKKEYY
jgi:hypothetical protein